MAKRKERNQDPRFNEKDQALIRAQEKAVGYLKDHGLGEREQTKITLFLQSTQLANSIVFPRVEFQNMDWLFYKFYNQQVFKNMEIIKLLMKITRWTFDPLVYVKFGEIVSSFWSTADLLKHFRLNFTIGEIGVQFYDFLAFSHALLSEVRFTPLVLDLPENDYIRLLYEIEEENGRQIQLQVRLLKELDIPLTLNEKEGIILSKREKIGEVYKCFLDFLCEG